MGFIICAGIFVLVWCFPSVVLCVFTHVPSVLKYGIKDLFYNLKYKVNSLPKMGQCICFTGLFGMGKTLSAVHVVRMIYHTYNGKRVFCPRRKKWVTFQVNIVSNVDLKNIPFVPFKGFQQLVDVSKNIRDLDDKYDTLTFSPFLIDEAGAVLNCREYRNNIDPLTLNSILTCRHANISIYCTAQRFIHLDALLRQVTTYVYDCKKIWRFQFQRKYDAWALEQAQDSSKIPCMSIVSWFVRDVDYDSYDTYQFVDELIKHVEEGHMYSEDEILSRLSLQPANLEVNKKVKKHKPRYLF